MITEQDKQEAQQVVDYLKSRELPSGQRAGRLARIILQTGLGIPSKESSGPQK